MTEVEQWMERLAMFARIGDALVSDVMRPAPMAGRHLVVRFENGYGASVVNEYDMDAMVGLGAGGALLDPWPLMPDRVEIAVIVFDGDGHWNLTYATDVTGDVLRRLTLPEADQALLNIASLTPDGRGRAVERSKDVERQMMEIVATWPDAPTTVAEATVEREKLRREREEESRD